LAPSAYPDFPLDFSLLLSSRTVTNVRKFDLYLRIFVIEWQLIAAMIGANG
jgi:hypothetical protein